MIKKKKNFFALKILSVLVFVVAIFTGGFIFLDKVIVPKYFGVYNINRIGDLFGVVSSLYSSPDEEDIVTNGFENKDFESGVQKLKNSGYKIEENGLILSQNISEFKGSGNFVLTEKEFSAICNKFLQTELLKISIQDLKYIGLENIEILDFVINLNDEDFDEILNIYSKANVSLDIKIKTNKLKSQIANQMETPDALIKIIIPDEIYFTVNFEIDLENQSEIIKNCEVSINGKNTEKSEVLINLLIEFIYPKEENMSIEKLSINISNIVIESLNSLGEFQFVKNVDNSNLNGIIIKN